jgi:membrane-bound serine protease (ClpP class)
MGPNTAFCFVIFGVLGIYYEFIWPRRILPGICGAAAAVTGGYFLWHASPTPFGLELLAAAMALFVLDAFVETFYIAGTVATIAQTVGFIKLILSPHEIRPLLAIPWCIAFGVITIALNWASRRARRNKLP